MASLTDYIQRVQAKYPGGFATADPFPKTTLHAPTLLKGQTNRVLVYRGSFSPPHIGHLAVLKHALEHGGRDLNIIAAIVAPVNGYARPVRATCSRKILWCTMEQRAQLWKNDDRVPAQAGVYKGQITNLTRLMYCLVEAAKGDGYELEFVALLGPDNSGWLEEPYWQCEGPVTLVDDDGVEKQVTYQGCQIKMICDAARKAGFDTGGLKRFEGCEAWGRPVLDMKVLTREAKAKAVQFLNVLEEKERDEFQRLVDGAGSEAVAIDDIVKRSLAEAVSDNQHIAVCRASNDERMLIRFVKLDRSAPGFQEVVVSGTLLRKAIETEDAER